MFGDSPVEVVTLSFVNRFVLVLFCVDIVYSSHYRISLTRRFVLSYQRSLSIQVLSCRRIVPRALNSNVCQTVRHGPVV